MKKLFAIVIALFFVSAAFAQHTNVVNQSGIDNGSYVEQSFNGGGTTFPGNEAFVDQIGNYNESTINQENNGFAGSGELADVYQNGTYNKSIVDQYNDGHNAFVYQLGHVNEAKIVQWNNKDIAEVTQVGDYNFGSIHQFGVANTWSWIRQYGISNTAKQELGEGLGFGVDNSNFTAFQQGNYNKSIQYLEGLGWAGGVTSIGNSGQVTQYGTYNDAEQIMMNGTGFVAEGNFASLYANGNSNVSDQYMRRNDNSSVVSQVGDWNTSVSKQNW